MIITMALFFCGTPVRNTVSDSHAQISRDIENYILDVIYETDLFDLITDDERLRLDSLYDELRPASYYIELLMLYGKYYYDESML